MQPNTHEILIKHYKIFQHAEIRQMGTIRYSSNFFHQKDMHLPHSNYNSVWAVIECY